MNDRFEDWKLPVFDKDGWTKYGWRCQHHQNLKLGKYVDIGCFTYLNAKYGIKIGDNVQIGAGCAIYSEDTERGVKGEVVIGKNALIGAHCVILPCVIIEENAKIRIGSVLK
jgi:acetyltransferase-like isoleucine patch superfamily enzyme